MCVCFVKKIAETSNFYSFLLGHGHSTDYVGNIVSLLSSNQDILNFFKYFLLKIHSLFQRHIICLKLTYFFI